MLIILTMFLYAPRLIKEEGLLCGGSSGASMACAMRAAADLGPDKKCVVILPDGIRNYMTKFLDNNWLVDREIIQARTFSKLLIFY